MAENSENLRTTLINSKDIKFDDKTIKILSIDFAYLICNSNYKNNNEKTILIDYEDNEPIYLYNFDYFFFSIQIIFIIVFQFFFTVFFYK